MFGISGGEFFVLLLVIVIVVGPQRLPEYTSKLTQLVRQLRLFIDNAKEQIAEEVGPELGDLSLKDLDPRNYDPRKIVRDALGEDLDAIRKDLTNPFESVLSTARKTSDDAAAAISQDARPRSKKSLSEMIEDKAQETRQAKEESRAGAQASPQPETQTDSQQDALGGDQAPADAGEQTVAEAEQTATPDAGTAEREAVAAASADDQDETVPETAEDLEPAPAQEGTGDDVEEPGEGLDPQEAPEPAAQEQQHQQEQDEPDIADEPAAGMDPAEETSRRELLTDAVDTVTEAVADMGDAVTDVTDGVSGLAEVPSTLVAEDAASPARPLSPREIVRAANAAARTRREAASAVVK
ncbi:Sec-independent protein translocase TatB [Actinomyces faecalis]|uniref:Sec-independent protein translocase TatB n=1 Tax=Actinomyces faecalis TaxID=2722820 RepID=UPI0015579075|nr:Sec-independent protein translocase TatB [Actinomyces faecalis]